MARVGERPALDYNGSYAAAKEVSHAQLAGSMRPYFVWSLLARRNSCDVGVSLLVRVGMLPGASEFRRSTLLRK